MEKRRKFKLLVLKGKKSPFTDLSTILINRNNSLSLPVDWFDIEILYH